MSQRPRTSSVPITTALDASPASPRPDARARAFDRVAMALLVAGVVVQIALGFPLHRYPAEADDIVGGIQALDILHGRFPTFYVEERLGSIGSYLTAVLFAVFGPTRAALALYPVAAGTLTLVLAWGFWREAFHRTAALLALALVVLPSPSFAFWTYMPTAYPLIPPLCLGILWTTLRIARCGPNARRSLVLGLLAGLGWWQSPQTVMCTGPALLWLAWRLRRTPRALRFLAVTALGAAAGAAPWIVYNVLHPLASLRVYGARGATGAGAAIENLRYLVAHSLPELVAPDFETLAALLTDVGGRLLPVLRPVVCALALAATAALASKAARDGVRSQGDADAPSSWPLILAVLGTTLLLNIVSEAGERRGFTVRYLLPAQLVLPGVLAAFLVWVARRARPLAWGLAAVLLIADAAGLHWPGRPSRRQWELDLRRAETLRRAIEGAGVQVVLGEYWETYPVNFWTAGRVLALPCRFDFTDREALLPAAPGRWALLANKNATLDLWSARAGVVGRPGGPASDPFLVFDVRPSVGETNRALLRRLLGACPGG